MPAINRERLILARESRGYNQTEVNDMLGLSVTTYSKIENGEITPSDELLGRIAQLTKYPVSFFSQLGSAKPQPLASRRRVKVAKSVSAPIDAKVNILSFQVQDLTSTLGIKPPLLPHWDVTDTFTPVEVAKTLRALWKIPDGPIGNLTWVIEGAGIPVWAFDFETDRIDSRPALTSDKLPIICINKRQPADRQRFSLAYQLGHLLMHTFNDTRADQDTGHEANLFAAELLMPESQLAEPFSNTITMPILGGLKRTWRVSMISLLYRADDLGYITPNQKRYLINKFNDIKVRKTEPPEFDFPAEEPLLIRKWLATLKRREKLNTEGLAARMHMNVEEFVEQFG